MNTPQNNELNESFIQYTFEIATDILLGVVLGVIVNMVADYVGKILHLPRYGVLVVQFFLICGVLYLLKVDSKYLSQSWKGQTSYGIVFTAVFLAVQKNLINFFGDIYLDINNTTGMFK